jgi:hypothetical protein
MSQFKEILKRLARYYGGEYTETHIDEYHPTQHTFEVNIVTPRTKFRFGGYINHDEPVDIFEDRIRYEMIWMILQQGVEFVNKKSDIFHLFNPDKHL